MIEFKSVSKQFGNFFANKNLDFKIKKGTIHGLVGENGAGKSTAMKVLFGLYRPSSGEILIRGKRAKIKNPIEAMKLGIGMVHQHFMLAHSETVLDNIILGHEPRRYVFFIDRTRAARELNEISKKYGLNFTKFNANITDLSVGEQQRVEILKLLYQKSEVLILDEPTAVLTPQEVKELFENLKRLKNEGKTIVLISHKLKEVLEFTDFITVMRRGECVGTVETRTGVTESQLAEMMVGRKVSFTYQGERKMTANATSGQAATRAIMQVKNLSLGPLHDLNLELRPGEILGIGGVQGNGQTEFLKFLSRPYFYSRKFAMQGEYKINSKSMLDATALELRKNGVGIVPEDRHDEGLLLTQDMSENFLLGQHEDRRYVSEKGFVKRKILQCRVESKIKEYDIRPAFTTVWSGRMSGGNQQKLLMARALDPNPAILYIAHPTRGVDVGAIERIHDIIMKERNAGKAILLFSSELDELIDLSDRILIFFEGRARAEFARPEFDAWAMGRVMGGGEK